MYIYKIVTQKRQNMQSYDKTEKTDNHKFIWLGFDILNRLKVAHECDRQADGQTGRQNSR